MTWADFNGRSGGTASSVSADSDTNIKGTDYVETRG